MKVGSIEAIEYTANVCGRGVRLLGPRDPYARFNDADTRSRSRADGYAPYWTTPWPAAVMLAEYVIRNIPVPPGPMLELGAGLGLCAVALAMHGYPIIATDYDAEALAFIKSNAELNGVQLTAVRRLDWRAPPNERFQHVLGADVLYDKNHIEPVAAMLNRCLHENGAAMMSDQHRADAARITNVCGVDGMTVDAVDVTCQAIQRPDAVDGRTLRGRVFVIRSTRGRGS